MRSRPCSPARDRNGSFGLWSAGGDDAWLDAYVTDFLTRARGRGFSVPDEAFKLAHRPPAQLSSSTAPEPATDGGLALAYALYVLARNGVAPVGDLRYLADAKINDLTDRDGEGRDRRGARHARRPRRVPRRCSTSRSTRSPRSRRSRSAAPITARSLRDAAVLVTLAAEGDARKADPHQCHRARGRGPQSRAAAPRRRRTPGSCSPRARSASRMSASMSNRPSRSGLITPPTIRLISRRATSPSPIPATPRSTAVVTVSGAPTTPEPAAEHGFKLERSFHTLDGEDADIANAKQNQRFVVVLKITERAAAVRARGADRLSAGRLRDRQSAARLLRRHRHARLDRGRRHAGAYRVPRRPLHRGLRPYQAAIRRCSPWPMWCGRYRPETSAAAGWWSRTCTVPTASAAPAPARSACRPPNEPAIHVLLSPAGRRRALGAPGEGTDSLAARSPLTSPLPTGRGAAGCGACRLCRRRSLIAVLCVAIGAVWD